MTARGPIPETIEGMAPRRLAVRLLVALVLAATAMPATGEEVRPPPTVPIDDALRPLDAWLRNDEWTVRSIAVLDLHNRSEPGAVFLAARTLAGEKQKYAAACALKALSNRPRVELVMEGGTLLGDALMRYVDAPHPTIRDRARAVLMRLPSVRLGHDFERYRGWWKRGRQALDEEQRSLLAKAPRRRPAPASTGTTETGAADDDLYEHLERLRIHGLELCVVLDDTGSMGPVIGAAKAGAVGLVKRLQTIVPKFRAGLVTYKDQPYLAITLTHNGAALEKAFRKIAASGGGDYEEGVDKGVRMALKQERLGWSRAGQRVLVVVGDAPPHERDVGGLLSSIRRAREDELYDFPVIVHTISTRPGGVEHFGKIAAAGGGQHVTLNQVGRIVEELVILCFGGGEKHEQVTRWLAEIDALRKAEPRK